jgi:hypothetical protein
VRKISCGLLSGVSAEVAFPILAREYHAAGALLTGGLYVFLVVLDVDQHHLLRNPVDDVLRALSAPLAMTLLAAKLAGNPA